MNSAAFCTEDGSLYVADFTSFCVFRFAADDSRGHVVAGEDGKQLMDVDYLKDIVEPAQKGRETACRSLALDAHRFAQDIDRPLASPEGEGFLLKNPIDVVSSPRLAGTCSCCRFRTGREADFG